MRHDSKHSPGSERIRLSVSICRTRRGRVEPRESRMPNSRERPEFRASWRFARFAQAIRRTEKASPTIIQIMMSPPPGILPSGPT